MHLIIPLRIAVLLPALLLTGCTQARWQDATGKSFAITRWGIDTSIGKATVDLAQGTATVDGYADQQKVADAIISLAKLLSPVAPP
jgi:hypothetical protein